MPSRAKPRTDLNKLASYWRTSALTAEQMDDFTDQIGRLISFRLRRLYDRSLYKDAFQSSWVRILRALPTTTMTTSTLVFSCVDFVLLDIGRQYRRDCDKAAALREAANAVDGLLVRVGTDSPPVGTF